MMKQQDYYKLVGMGLQLDRAFTLEANKQQDLFWCERNMEREKFLQLFNWAKSDDMFWKEHNWHAMIEHEGTYDDNTPKNPKILYIQDLNA